MAATVPHALEQRLAALVPRVRALRVARGASLCLLAAVASVTLALFLDAALGLPATARGLLVAVWVTALGVFVWQFVVAPWQTEIPLADVARELERRLPELADRLGAVIAPPPHTSDAVRTALLEDTLRRAKAVDFHSAIPAYPAMLRASGALLALLAFLMLTGLVPDSAERLRRIALPWARPPAQALRVVVTSGEPVVKRGGPVTLTAFAERTGSRPGPVPENAVATFRDAPGAPEEPVTMAADGAGVFHATRAVVARDFEYRVQIGGAASEWFRVTALDPVEPAPGTRFEITAPAYTKRPPRALPALTDFEALDGSRFTAHLKFTQPPAAAQFEWRAMGDTKPDPVVVELAPDRLSGSASLVLRSSGELKLVLVRDRDGRKLRTVLTAGVRVNADKAPWFETLTGVSARPRSVRPGERVPIVLVACDDFCVSGARLEYTHDSFDSRTETLPIPLTGENSPRATGRLDLDPAALAPGGGTIRFRIRVGDNRVPEDPKLGAQETLYPPTGWSELTLSAAAPPLEEQDVLHQRDTIRAAAESARGAVREATNAVATVRAEVTSSGPLSVDQSVRLNAARDRTRRATAALTDLAGDAGLVPETRPLAAAARDLTAGELRTAEAALARAEADEAGRAEALAEIAARLDAATARLDALLLQNAAIARARLDRARLGALAHDQAALANTKLSAREFSARQRELIARLKALAADSEPLRLAFEGAGGDEVRAFAREIAELTDAVRELDDASRRTAAEAWAALAVQFASDQDVLAGRAGRLFAALETPARLAGLAPPRASEFRKVADLAAAGNTVGALTEVELQTQAVERVADEFEVWATERADPKKAAKQIALWQDDLLTRFRAATQTAAFDKLPAGARAAVLTEQRAIRAAIGRLHTPAGTAIKTARDSALAHCGRAHDLLSADGRGADPAMRLCAEALTRLADRTPPAGERLNKSRAEFDRVRTEQESIANAVDQVLRGSENQPAVNPVVAKKLAALAERQRWQSSVVATLDLPGLGARQDRAGAVLASATADLQDAVPFDVQASQLLVRREFERLKLALEGTAPSDTKCNEFHRRLGAIADTLDAHGPNLTVKLLEPYLPVVQDTLKQLPAVAPEASALLNDARVALQTAEVLLRDGTKGDEARRRVRAAAEALGRLGDRLDGTETDFDRVQRLAGYRRAAAVRAKELADAKAPFSAPASDEALRQMAREIEELAHTRVGPAGQAAKKRVLDQYARLGARREPDRFPSDQRALAEALDELAVKMADIAELATVPPPEPLAAIEADAYLPSQPFADQLRELVKQQRGLHERLTALPRVLADRLRPAATNPFTALEVRQRALARDLAALGPEAAPVARAAGAVADALRNGFVPGAKEGAEAALRLANELTKTAGGKQWAARAVELSARQGARLDDITKLAGASNAAALQQMTRAGELAGRAAALADALERAAKFRPHQDPARAALTEASAAVRTTAKKLLEAGQKAAETDASRATTLRAESLERVRAAHARVSTVLPTQVSVNPELGAALRAAERAMRAALEPTPDPRTSATDAANALRTAASHAAPK